MQTMFRMSEKIFFKSHLTRQKKRKVEAVFLSVPV